MSKADDYQVLARRFRPQTFEEVVGQDAILQSLESALSAQRLPHALLFAGSRGVGKTTLARILARCLNCERGVSKDPCGTCTPCRTILDGSNTDVVEIDAASHNLVDDIRELRERVGFASMGSRYKVYILDEVHMLTRSAFNAFLKTLEEPPPKVVFVMATTEPHKVPETIRSRCQVLLFQRVGEVDIRRRLRAICAHEDIAVPDAVLAEIARSCRGGMRDAETILERVLPVAAERGDEFGLEEYYRLTHRTGLDGVVAVVADMLQGDAAAALHFVTAAVDSGVDEREALGEVLEVLRALLLIKIDGPETGLVQLQGELRSRLNELAEGVDTTRLDAMVHAGLLGRERIRRLEDRRLVLEVTLLRMVAAGQLPRLAELVEQLGTQSGNVTPVAAAGSPPAVAAGSPPAAGAGSPPAAGAGSPPAAGAGSPPAAGAGSPPAAGAGSPPAAGDAVPAAPPPTTLHGQLIAACREEKEHSLLGRSLEECRVAEPDQDGMVHIEVLSPRKMHRDRLTSEGVQQQLREMISKILGQDARLTVTLADSEAAAATAKPARKASAPPKPGAAVRKVLKRFDGRVLKVNEQDFEQQENEQLE
ncbi:MAG: DNA polymerase III subunit gamma/tau [Planctomycetota bacterium]